MGPPGQRAGRRVRVALPASGQGQDPSATPNIFSRRVAVAAPKFPVLAPGFPVSTKKFPVLLRREFGCKRLNSRADWTPKLQGRGLISQNSLLISHANPSPLIDSPATA